MSARTPKNSSRTRGCTRNKDKKDPERVTTARLDAMIEEATVDAYGESEQLTGFYTMIEENVVLPFTTTVLGIDVTVESIEQGEDEAIVAVCRRGRDAQRIPVLDLPLPRPRPKGAEWIEALRRWARGR